MTEEEYKAARIKYMIRFEGVFTKMLQDEQHNHGSKQDFTNLLLDALAATLGNLVLGESFRRALEHELTEEQVLALINAHHEDYGRYLVGAYKIAVAPNPAQEEEQVDEQPF